MAMADENVRDPLGITGVNLDGKFEVGAAIGEGGSAVVYRAVNKTWNLPVAIKFYVALSSAPEEMREKLLGEFVQEGQILLQLSSRSPAIVQPRDMGAYTSPSGAWLPYLVLEWLDGSPLDIVLVDETNRGMTPRNLTQSMALLGPVVRALAMAHADKIVHRDIKPENMFVLGHPRGPDARVKLLDFGIAKVMHGQFGNLLQTAAAATPFTPHYGAPEQFSRGYGATGPWTDVFALALVVLEVMRGGERAFKGDDYLELGTQSRDENHRPTPRALGLTVNDDVEAVFARALAIGPQDRYASAAEFWEALEGAVASDPDRPRSPSAPLPKPQRTSVPPVRSTPALATPPSEPGKKGGSRSIILGAAAIGVLLIGSAAVFGAKRVLGEKASGSASAVAATSAAPVGSTAPSSSSKSVAAIPSADASGVCPPSTVPIVGGKFDMGSGSIEKAGPEHGVFVDAFCLDRTEVTAKDYGACVEAGKCKAPALEIHEEQPSEGSLGGRSDARVKQCTFGAVDRGAHPINCVSFDEAATYCASKGMRLPTEAEWEYAATGSERRKFPWGNEAIEGRVNACGPECLEAEKDMGRTAASSPAYASSDKYPATSPVASFPGGNTKTGVADLSGNVAEWTASYFGPYPEDDEVNPRGPASGERRVVRGGGFECGEDRLLSQARGFAKPDTRTPEIGFRCASALLKR